LILGTGRRVRKAVIPAAGFSAHLFPASKAVKKELFPVIDSDGRVKPVILTLVEEAVRAGIEEVCIIVQPQDKKLFEEFFNTVPVIENFNRLSREDQNYCQYILDLGHRIKLIAQEHQEGFGHAVYCARDWVVGEPFLLMLGDHIYRSSSDTSCARQLLDVYDKVGSSVVGLKKTAVADIHHFGCVTGIWDEPNSILSITEFAEKPEKTYAEEHLHVEGMKDNLYLTIFGQYILSPKIFDILEDRIQQNIREKGDFQLTSCLDVLRKEEGFVGYLIQGKRFDIGSPESYLQTVIDFNQS
jgi:UTP--glucose-1-phosphate uridylyltransferase